MKEQKFRKLEVWIKAMDFVEEVYRLTNKFPTKEMYGLISQLNRSATSIALNIAEGSGAGSDNEFCRFLNIALRSAYEAMCGIEVAVRLNYCSTKEADVLLKDCDTVCAMISGLKRKLKADSG